jgi:Uma2 family endonuclease
MNTPRFPVRRFTVAEYRAMGVAGILTEDDNVELLDGWIVPKMNHNPRHDATIQLVDDAIRLRLAEGWTIRIQSAITTDESEPEPDLAVVQGPLRTYVDHHPGRHDIAMVVEVADSSLARDRAKGQIYAQAGIAVYWIVSLNDQCIEVYTEPTGPDSDPQYRRREDFHPGDVVPLIIAGTNVGTIEVRDLLP